MKKRIILGISGASGAIYGIKLFDSLINYNIETHVVLSHAGEKVLSMETGLSPIYFKEKGAYIYKEDHIEACIASGSWHHDGMVICPCSMASVGAISNGFGHNLLHRAADVSIKERRKLILVVRETPFNEIHLENLLKLCKMGVIILPASPGFYQHPTTIKELIDFIVCRVLDQLNIENQIYPRWKGKSQN